MFNQPDVASLVPECYAEYRRVVSEGVMFFLGQLSKPRLAKILAEQTSLPSSADTGARVVRLMHHSPALHKLGQVIARRRELDESLRRRLQRLETMAPRTDMSQIMPLIERQLGPAKRRYRIQVEKTPLAEASVAVVVPLTWSDGAKGERREGVLKVLKPGVANRLTEDLEILGRLADYTDEHRKAWRLPEIAFRETFEDVRRILTHEIQFEREQANLVAAGAVYARWPNVQVPAVLPFSTKSLTAMQRVHGVKVTQVAGKGNVDQRRRRLAETIVRALVAEPVFSRANRALFHGDPHAGNLMATDDGRLAILDWSLTGELQGPEREQLAQILTGGMALDGQRIGQGLESLATGSMKADALRPVVQRALAEARGNAWTGVDWLMGLVDSAARAGARFRADLLLFRKSFFTLEGIVADLCEKCTMEQTLMKAMLEKLAGEWPLRWIRPMHSRAFATHLSSADLLQLGAMMPLSIMQRWMGAWGGWAA